MRNLRFFIIVVLVLIAVAFSLLAVEREHVHNLLEKDVEDHTGAIRKRYGHVDTVYQHPRERALSAGVFFLFHGCGRSEEDWFSYPEELLMTQFLLEHGYSVVGLAKQSRVGCWKREEADWVVEGMKLWILDNPLVGEGKERVPFFGLGASSGGSFVVALSSHLIDAAERRKDGDEGGGPELLFSGLVVQIAPIRKEVMRLSSPPMVVQFMPKDPSFGPRSPAAAALDQVRNAYETPIKLLPLLPRHFGSTYFAELMPNDFSEQASISLFERWKTEGYFDCSSDSGLCTIVRDPRRHIAVMKPALDNVERSGPLLWERVLELLNVAYARHEISSEGRSEWLEWLEQEQQQ